MESPGIPGRFNTSKIDGQKLGKFGSGITVLPGEHLLDIQITAKGSLRSCQLIAHMNTASYQSCLWVEGYGKRYCDCYDYLRMEKHCVRLEHDGTCRGEARSEARRNYEIGISFDGRDAQAAVNEKGSDLPVAKLQCVLTNPHDVEVTTELDPRDFDCPPLEPVRPWKP